MFYIIVLLFTFLLNKSNLNNSNENINLILTQCTIYYIWSHYNIEYISIKKI